MHVQASLAISTYTLNMLILEMDGISYGIASILLQKIDQQTYVALFLASQETIELTSEDLLAKEEVEQLLGTNLRHRNIDWVATLANLDYLTSQQASLDDCLVTASGFGFLEEVSILLEAGANPSSSDNASLIAATKENRVEIASVLLASPLIDPSLNNNAAYRIANRDGFYQLAEVLSEDRRVRELLA